MQRTSLLLAALAGSLASCAAQSGELRTFEVENRFELDVPEGARSVRAWFALPDDHDPLQDVDALDVSVTPSGAGVSTREVRDADGNRFLFLEGEGVGGQKLTVTTSFDVSRREQLTDVDPDGTRPHTDAELTEMARYLRPSSNIVLDDDVRRVAREVVAGEQNPIRASRLIYDWTLDHVTYWVKHPDRMKSSGVGSSTYCMSEACGNCTDFHSLYVAVSRAAGIPARMVYGSFFKGPLDGAERDQSYHCWVEFHAPEVGWVPIDVAVADVYIDDFAVDEANAELVSLTLADGYDGPDPGLVDYYFGNLDARRVTWHRGRDLRLSPSVSGGPVNALPKAYVEYDGAAAAEKAGWTRLLTFRER